MIRPLTPRDMSEQGLLRSLSGRGVPVRGLLRALSPRDMSGPGLLRSLSGRACTDARVAPSIFIPQDIAPPFAPSIVIARAVDAPLASSVVRLLPSRDP